MRFEDQLLKNLEVSCNKHGETQIITLGHLKNLVALTIRQVDKKEKKDAVEDEKLLRECLEWGMYDSDDWKPR